MAVCQMIKRFDRSRRMQCYAGHKILRKYVPLLLFDGYYAILYSEHLISIQAKKGDCYGDRL